MQGDSENTDRDAAKIPNQTENTKISSPAKRKILERLRFIIKSKLESEQINNDIRNFFGTYKWGLFAFFAVIVLIFVFAIMFRPKIVAAKEGNILYIWAEFPKYAVELDGRSIGKTTTSGLSARVTRGRHEIQVLPENRKRIVEIININEDKETVIIRDNKLKVLD